MADPKERTVKPIGLTEAVGYQVGVRRTLLCSKEEAWRYLMSKDGIAACLGYPEGITFEKGSRYGRDEESHGEVRVLKPREQIRLTWYQAGWSRASTLQIRLIGVRPTATTVSFHQERLDNGDVRQQMKEKWERVLVLMSESISSSS